MAANIEIEGGEIVIRIPIDALPIAAPIAFDGAYGFGNHAIAVTDVAAFAREFLIELKRESETGETAVTRMLDAAVVRAFENGAEGLIGEVRPT